MCVYLSFVIFVTFNRINNNNNNDQHDLDMLIASRGKQLWGFINDFIVWEEWQQTHKCVQLINYIIFLKKKILQQRLTVIFKLKGKKKTLRKIPKFL